MMRLVVSDGDWGFRLIISNQGLEGTIDDPLNRNTQFVGQYRWRDIISPELTQLISQNLTAYQGDTGLVDIVRTVLYGMSRCSAAESFFRRVAHEEELIQHHQGSANLSRPDRRSVEAGFTQEYPHFTPVSSTDSPHLLSQPEWTTHSFY